jgi:hypothetical protein
MSLWSGVRSLNSDIIDCLIELGYNNMLNKITTVQECDATDDDSSNAADLKNIKFDLIIIHVEYC